MPGYRQAGVPASDVTRRALRPPEEEPPPAEPSPDPLPVEPPEPPPVEPPPSPEPMPWPGAPIAVFRVETLPRAVSIDDVSITGRVVVSSDAVMMPPAPFAVLPASSIDEASTVTASAPPPEARPPWRARELRTPLVSIRPEVSGTKISGPRSPTR